MLQQRYFLVSFIHLHIFEIYFFQCFIRVMYFLSFCSIIFNLLKIPEDSYFMYFESLGKKNFKLINSLLSSLLNSVYQLFVLNTVSTKDFQLFPSQIPIKKRKKYSKGHIKHTSIYLWYFCCLFFKIYRGKTNTTAACHFPLINNTFHTLSDTFLFLQFVIRPSASRPSMSG